MVKGQLQFPVLAVKMALVADTALNHHSLITWAPSSCQQVGGPTDLPRPQDRHHRLRVGCHPGSFLGAWALSDKTGMLLPPLPEHMEEDPGPGVHSTLPQR